MQRNAFAIFNPWMLWADFALKSTEMLFASGQVIGSRVNRMASAGHNPSARDRKEFMLMGTEKLKAASDSSLAMTAAMTRLWQPWLAAGASMSKLSGAAAQVAAAGLQPVHAAATANARRLSRTRTRRTRGG